MPATHLFAHAVRVDRLLPQLEVQAPEMGGWLRKETRMRPQRLDRAYVTSVGLGPSRSRIALRMNPEGTGPGFDVELEGKAVGLKRIGETPEDVIDIELSDEDAAKLRGLFDKVAAALADVSKGRRQLLSATLDGVKTTQYAFREGQIDWQVWIQQGDQPLPRKVVIVDRRDPAGPAYIARLTWTLNPPLSDADFAFRPGENATRIRLTLQQ